MSFEFLARFHNEWLVHNRAELIRAIRSLPSYIGERGDEFWLKDPKSKHVWESDVRLILRTSSVRVEVSAWSDAYYRDLKHLVDEISTTALVSFVNNAEEPITI